MSDAIVGERTRSIVMALSVLSLVATVVGLVYGRKLSPRDVSPYDSYGRGPLGTRVFVESLAGVGISSSRETDVDRIRATNAPVLFLAPESPSQVIDDRVVQLAEVIDERTERGARSIVVLPKWELSDFGIATPLLESDVEGIARATGFELAVRRSGRRTDRPKRRPLDSTWLTGLELELPFPQTVSGSDDLPRFATLDAEGLVLGYDDAMVVVITDSDLVSNFSVTRADHAEVVVALLRSLGIRRVVVDETFHGRHATKSLAELLGEWPGVLLLVQGAFVVAAVLLAGRKRFGRPRRQAEAYGRGPREAIAVAADVLTLGRSPERHAARYVELLIRDIHRRLGLHEDGHTVDVVAAAEALDRLAVQRKITIEATTLLADARAMTASTTKKREALAKALSMAMRAYALRRAWLGLEGAVGEST